MLIVSADIADKDPSSSIISPGALKISHSAAFLTGLQASEHHNKVLPSSATKSTECSTMGAKVDDWPAWPEFTAETGEKSDDLIDYKRAIANRFGAEHIRNSWLEVCEQLKYITDDIASRGSAAIPEVQYDEFFTQSPEQRKKLMDIGCFAVRNVFDREQADAWFRDLKSYVEQNTGRYACRSMTCATTEGV